MPKLVSRSEVETVWREIPIPVQQQVERFENGKERWTLKAPFWVETFKGSTLAEALANLYNRHPLR